MSSWLIALLIAIAASAWTWNKMIQRTRRRDTSATVTAVVGVILFIVLLIIFKSFLHL